MSLKKISWNRKFRYQLEYSALIFFRWFLKNRSINFKHSLGEFIGKLAFLLGIRKKVIQTNLSIAFPEKSNEEKNTILREFYFHYGRELAETINYDDITLSDFNRVFPLSESSSAALDKIRSKPCILFLNHMVNVVKNERYCLLNLKDTYFFSGKQNNPKVQSLLQGIRKTYPTNVEVVRNKQFILTLLHALRAGKRVGVAVDLNAPGSKLFESFFGVQASLSEVPFFLAYKSKVPIYFVSLRLYGKERGEMVIEEINMQPSESREEFYHQGGRKYLDLLEREIRLAPHQYFWFNKRWKERPADDQQKIY